MTIRPSQLLAQGGLNDWLHRIQFRTTAGTDAAIVYDWVYMLIFWISLVAFVILMALMFWFMIAYRRRGRALGARSAPHNTPLELAWTIIPTIFLVWMFFEGFWGFSDAIVAPGDAIELTVKGRKWQWEIGYPNGATTGQLMTGPADTFPGAKGTPGAKSVPIIVAPVNKAVKLRMISEDVIHAFWMPDFRMKFDVVPNRYTVSWFKARPDQLGDHWVFCAEYCGNDHSEMLAIIRIVPMEEYLQTIAKWGRPESPEKWGKVLWQNKCSSCHTIDGTKSTGPTWLGMFGKMEDIQGLAEQKLVDEDYVRESILFPKAKLVLGFKDHMQSFNGLLTEDEISALIAFMKSIGKDPPPPATPGEAAPAGEGN